MKLALKFALLTLTSLFFVGVIACGSTDQAPNQTTRTQDAHDHDQHKDHGHDHKGHDHDHDHHSHDITLKHNICKIEKSDMSDFEVVCPQNVEKISYASITSGKKISLKGSNTSLSIKKTADNRVVGSTTNFDIEIKLIFADGSEEFIQTP